MRLCMVVGGTLFAAFAVALATAVALAAPRLNHGLTINATPKPIIAGEAVLIYGQLNGPDSGARTVVLHQRINPAGAFTVAHSTVTNAGGFYEFIEPVGVVTSNRSWFVTSPGPGSLHSRIVHELAAAALTLEASATVGETKHPMTFSGSVLPDVHAGEQVLLQEQAGGGGAWRTIGQGAITPGSSYTIAHDFLLPGARVLRAVFGGDSRNVRAQSDSLSVVVEQTENSSFTLASSAPTEIAGDPVTISGTLFAHGTTTPLPFRQVTLWGREVGDVYEAIASTLTGSDGSYSFSQQPSHNEVYQVRTTLPPNRVTAQLFEGVGHAVTIGATSTSSSVGGTVSFVGTVAPDGTGEAVYLERLGTDGHFQVIREGVVKAGSTYGFTVTFGNAGTKTFRVVVPGGEGNIGGASPPVAVLVTLPPVQSLPPAS
jgi:hypothetical protein